MGLITKYQFVAFQLFSTLFVKRENIKFSAILNLHNENIIINDIGGHRYYGFLRLILKDTFNNTIMENISIVNCIFEELEDKILSYIKNYIKNIQYKNLSKSKRSFSSIPIILSPQASGYFAHEILGHLLEEDFYDFYKGNYNDLKASKKFTIHDSIENYTDIIGLNKYDDLGVSIKPLFLLEKGKLVNILSTSVDKSFDKKLYSAARRENCRQSVIPRMKGTFILPHDKMNQTNIRNQYINALFLNKSYLGGVDPSSGIYTLTGDGFYVKNGEKKNFIGNLKLTGNKKKNCCLLTMSEMILKCSEVTV